MEQHDAMANDIWPVVHAERRALAGDLAGLTDEQWRTPSLCGGWSVHDVLAHMVSTAKLTPPAFFAGLIGSGFSFDRFTAKRIGVETMDFQAACRTYNILMAEGRKVAAALLIER